MQQVKRIPQIKICIGGMFFFSPFGSTVKLRVNSKSCILIFSLYNRPFKGHILAGTNPLMSVVAIKLRNNLYRIYLIQEVRTDCFTLLCRMACLLTVMICLLFLLGVIGRLWHVFMVISGHLLYYFQALSRKHTYIILIPLNPHFYIVKLGSTGVYIISFISAQKHRLLEQHRRGGSNEYPQSMFLSRIMKNIRICTCKLSVFCDEIFNTFEKACFRNGSYTCVIQLIMLFIWHSCIIVADNSLSAFNMSNMKIKNVNAITKKKKKKKNKTNKNK